MLVRIERTEPQNSWWPPRLVADDGGHVIPPPPNPDTDWHSWTAEYDALGRRVSTQWGERRRQFVWDGDRLAAEISPDGRLRVYQYASPEAWVPLAFTDYPSRDAAPDAGRSYHVFTNPVGMPLCIEDGDGKVVWWAARVDPYGLVELRSDAKIEYNLRWPGHYFDPETGLHYNRYRYYDPKLGRYLQSDPIGHEGSPINLYAYCGNPLVQVDVLGLAHPARTSGDGSENGPHSNNGKEGTSAQRAKGATTPEQRALAAAPNAGHNGKPTPAQLAARKRVAAEFIRNHGQRYDRAAGKPVPLTHKDREGHVDGTDYNHPVSVGPPPRIPEQLGQWQAPGNDRGSYFGPQGTTPGEMGIGDDGRAWSKPGAPAMKKVETLHTFTNPDQSYMKSTSAPIDDKWSIPAHGGSPGVVQPTPGGGTQYTVFDGCDPAYAGIRP
jgi:RHS repeat-associated protein